MKLASLYLFSMIEIVKTIFVQVLRAPPNMLVLVGPADHNVMMIIALYMGINSEAHQAMQAELRNAGPDVLDAWNRMFDLVNLRNQELAEHETIDIAAFLKKVSDENKRDDS